LHDERQTNENTNYPPEGNNLTLSTNNMPLSINKGMLLGCDVEWLQEDVDELWERIREEM
jgi:hypothetical protein